MKYDGSIVVGHTLGANWIDQTITTVPEPGVRYFLTEKGGSRQSWISEIGALILSFFFAGIMPLLIILFFIGWLSVKARSSYQLFVLLVEVFALSFLTLLIPIKTYDIKVLKWKLWNCLYNYFSL